MTTEQQYILQILSAFLRREKCPAAPPASLDWQAFLKEALAQGVCAICYFCMDKNAIPEKARKQWRAAAYYGIGACFRVMEAHSKVCKLLEENGVPTVCLKGYASAYYYPRPEYRAMGDVDFFVEDAYRTKARELLLANGYEEKDLKRHHDWLYYKHGISYELHFAISGVPRGKEGEPFLRALEGAVRERQWVKSKAGEIVIPSDFHHGLIILLHTASHLLSGGLGLRHLCDWAAFVNRFDDGEFRRVFQQEFESLRVWRFAQVLTAVCERYLGSKKNDWTGDVDADAVDKLMDEFLRDGDYDFNHEFNQSDLMVSEGFSVRVGHKSGIGNMMATLRNAVEYHWPRTQKNKVLLFFGMVYSVARYGVRILTGKREKLDFAQMSKEAYERRKLYQAFGLEEGIEE